MHCQLCQSTAPTRYVTFHENIGLFVIRFPKTLEGNLCKQCIHASFWNTTLTSMALGWWGFISFFTNIYFILNNISAYASCLWSMPSGAPQPSAREAPARIDFGAVRLERHAPDMLEAIKAGQSVQSICRRISDKASVPVADVRERLERLKAGS